MTSIVLTSYRPHRPTGGAPLRNWQNIKVLTSFGPVDVVSVCVDDPRETVDGIREWVPFSSASRTQWDRIKTACAPLRPGIHPGVDIYSSAFVKGGYRSRVAVFTMISPLSRLSRWPHILNDLKHSSACHLRCSQRRGCTASGPGRGCRPSAGRATLEKSGTELVECWPPRRTVVEGRRFDLGMQRFRCSRDCTGLRSALAA